MKCAKLPEESWEEPPAVKIHCSTSEKWKLFRKLDACGRLGMVSEQQIYQGYQSGLFSVSKDLRTCHWTGSSLIADHSTP